MGRAALEPQIAEEIEQYINFFIEPNHGKPIDLTCSSPQATANIISQLMFNQRFEFGDEKFNKLISAVNESVKLVQKLGLTANVPFNKYIFKSWQELSRQLNGFIATTFAEIITKNRIGFDGENPQGVIEHYIQHSKSEKGKDDFCFAGKVTLYRDICRYLITGIQAHFSVHFSYCHVAQQTQKRRISVWMPVIWSINIGLTSFLKL